MCFLISYNPVQYNFLIKKFCCVIIKRAGEVKCLFISWEFCEFKAGRKWNECYSFVRSMYFVFVFIIHIRRKKFSSFLNVRVLFVPSFLRSVYFAFIFIIHIGRKKFLCFLNLFWGQNIDVGLMIYWVYIRSFLKNTSL